MSNTEIKALKQGMFLTSKSVIGEAPIGSVWVVSAVVIYPDEVFASCDTASDYGGKTMRFFDSYPDTGLLLESFNMDFASTKEQP